VSRVSSTRSAALATSSALRRIPIRWRLAGGSALLTLTILAAFAGAVGALTSSRLHSEFDAETATVADRLQDKAVLLVTASGKLDVKGASLNSAASASNAAVRVVAFGGVVSASDGAPDLGPMQLARFPSVTYAGYRIENREIPVRWATQYYRPDVRAVIQFARPLADVEATVDKVRVFLLVGVVSGAGLALLAGLMIARRAMAPIAELTAAAREIERTRDPGQRIPQPEAHDEVAELAETLDGMLRALDASRSETEAALKRQREFVADASHELRTPLTSVLANLELLAETLDGERGEAAQSALRSSRRMRRLVADLLLLARADAERQAPRAPTDVGEVLMEAAGEVTPLAGRHELVVDADRAVVDGARDELHRLALNLMENALKHTPEGTHVRAAVGRRDGEVVLTVEDDGPGIPPDLRDRVFERFVRGAGDRGGSFGLGLSIVRAVAESHGGRVRVESPTVNGDRPAHGTRFVVTLPAAS
jgi:signal transduction histidine kinase